MDTLRITNTELKDLDFACSLYDKAIKYQKQNGYPEYRCDDRKGQQLYIENGTHYKAILGQDIVAIFHIHFSDKIVWREMDTGHSIYLHGVLINPKFKGNLTFGKILDWTIAFAQKENKDSIRLDTWHNNPNLVNYYIGFGFKEIEDFLIPMGEDVPLNCRGNIVTLMEYKL